MPGKKVPVAASLFVRTLKKVADRKKLVGELELAEPAARVLQYHWEILRFEWAEHLKHQQQHASSSKSSLIQHIT